MKLLLYCTKSKPFIHNLIGGHYILDEDGKYSVMDGRDDILNGKVVGECDFEVEEIELKMEYMGLYYCGKTVNGWDGSLYEKSQLDNWQLFDYLGGNKGYAIHIKNLNIYKSPRKLSSYTCVKAPQNMQYVYTYYDKNEYVLISIQPYWLCKILNGEKTIEVRKKVLKRMLENE